jgi:hypothetical protein
MYHIPVGAQPQTPPGKFPGDVGHHGIIRGQSEAN